MFKDIIYYLTIRPLEILFETVFFIVYRWIGKPFATLFALSLIVNILVFPLYKRADKLQSEQREREKAMESRISHIKKTFKGDEKVMMLQAYYRICDYKPVYALRGVSSLFLQIPFFIAAFRFLSGVSVLKGMPSILLPFSVPHYLIRDLGAPDAALMLFGHPINILPILMTLINIISGTVYSKGHLRKEKVQLYVTALVFLVLLYNSPAGLVIYWTFNNLFSLFKNIVQKIVEIVLKKSKVGSDEESEADKNITDGFDKKNADKTNNFIFLSGALFLALITGLYIPSNVLSASPVEFISDVNLFTPAKYLIYSLSLGIGFYVVWIGIYYLFSSAKIRRFFSYAMVCLTGISVIDYMMSGSGLGTISSGLKYDIDPIFGYKKIFLNFVLILLAILILAIILKFKPAVCSTLAFAGCVALTGISCMNISSINSEYNDFYDRYSASDVYDLMPQITLSKTGKNVIVFMLDRAMGPAIPYLLNERPDLMEIFDGFTYYHDTVSFGGYTNFGMPAVFGGYEYTPYEMNNREDELLGDKTDEALKVLPALFSQNEFGVTLIDMPYCNYSEISDYSIYDDIPGINVYKAEDKFFDKSNEYALVAVDDLKRNFYYFGQMKVMPLCLQSFLYNSGNYNSEKKIIRSDDIFADIEANDSEILSGQYNEDIKIADGINGDFMNWYTVLENLENITVINENESGEFLMMYNGTTHEPTLLQLPEYTPQVHVDNTSFDYELFNTLNGVTMNMDTHYRVEHYQVNMSALLRMGEWFDYLREKGVYDNTRIIIVADHGRGTGWFDGFTFDNINCEWYLPLLMVKDFDSHGFELSTEFMTNADACPLAVQGVIKNPINPFTGNLLDGHEKNEDIVRIIVSDDYDISKNNGYRFFPAKWYTVNGTPYDNTNWTYIGFE